MKELLIFHCLLISKIMTSKIYIALTKCLHIRNPTTYVNKRDLPSCDKMRLAKKLVDRVRKNFMNMSN
jgi:hypothetical protein